MIELRIGAAYFRARTDLLVPSGGRHTIIVEGAAVVVKCGDTGVETEGLVVSQSVMQVRVNMAGIPMTFRKQANGSLTTSHAGMHFVLHEI